MSDDADERGTVAVPTPAPQSEVVEFYRENAQDAASVGSYVRVQHGGQRTACFGPVESVRDGGHQWRVVEINWEANTFLLAPINDYGGEVSGDE
jgi:hypothetical protein